MFNVKVFNGTIVSKEIIKLTVDEIFGDGWDEEFTHIEILLEDGNYTSGIPDVDPSRLHIGDKITLERDWLSEYREKGRGLRLGDYKLIKIRSMP